VRQESGAFLKKSTKKLLLLVRLGRPGPMRVHFMLDFATAHKKLLSYFPLPWVRIFSSIPGNSRNGRKLLTFGGKFLEI
jgi:hypothetical protein